jgi:molybdopterin converting factor small subunit
MAVIVKAGGVLKSLLGGQSEISIEAGTIDELLAALDIRDRLCDHEGNLRRHFNIHVNEGEDVRFLQGLGTPVSDGDTVVILSAVAGGSEDVIRKVWLTFPGNLVSEPLIWKAGQEFKVVTNIRQASVAADVGLVGLELSGPKDEVLEAIDFFRNGGVSVELVELDVVE